MIVANDELETTFELPDRPTGRVILRYDSAIATGAASATLYERLWACVVACAQNWQSTPLPVLDLSILETEAQHDFERKMDVVKWAGLMTFQWRNDLNRRLEEALKNG